MNKKMNVLNVQLDDYSAKDAMKAVTIYMQNEALSTVEIVTVDILMQASRTEGLKEKIEEQDLVLAGDEAILEAAGVTERKKLQEARDKVFLKMLFRYFHKNNMRLFLLADKEEELELLAGFLERDYPGVEIAGREAVPEGEASDDMIINRINGLEVDCILAGMTSPKQEAFIGRCRQVLDARLWLGIGKMPILAAEKKEWKIHLREFVERKVLNREIKREKKKNEV